MKLTKILMLVSNIESKQKQQFIELIRANFKSGTTIEIGDLKDVWIDTVAGVTVQVGGIDIKSYDLVVFRGIRYTEYSLVNSIAICLTYLGIKYTDEIYGNLNTSEKKLSPYLKLHTSGVNVPKVVYYSGSNKEVYNRIKERLGIPFVAKDLYLQLGKGVFLIKTKSDFEKLNFEREYLFQEFLDKKHEYRVLVLGSKVGVFEEKIAGKSGEFRNNVALGAKEVFMDKNKTPKAIRDISIKAARTIKLQIAGVDVVVDTKGKIYILEVNRGPGLTYDVNVSPEFKEIAVFLEKYAKHNLNIFKRIR